MKVSCFAQKGTKNLRKTKMKFGFSRVKKEDLFSLLFLSVNGNINMLVGLTRLHEDNNKYKYKYKYKLLLN